MRLKGVARVACAAAFTLFVSTSSVLATPTFQTYIQGAGAGDSGADQDTWFGNSDSFNLVLVGAYSANTADLRFGTLAVSVPQGQTGTISIIPIAGATLLTATRSTSDGSIPNGNADVDALTDVAGYDAYADQSTSFNLNNHYPSQNGVADFLYYDVGGFADLGAIHNYDADAGTITVEGSGQEKVFAVQVTGFDWVHFDLIGYVDKTQGNDAWDFNPGSHDATVNPPTVPVPGSLLLGAFGAGLAGWMRRRRAL